MSAATHADIQKHIKSYVMVFVALAVLTVITVAASYWHIGTVPGIILAMIIASIKGTLVAGVFMHLFDEKKMIYWVLGLTMFFFALLLALPVMTSGPDEAFYSAPALQEKAHDDHGAGREAAAGHEAADDHGAEEEDNPYE